MSPSVTRRHQRGVALLEALIGFIIFSIGVLGLVGLQASMTRAQTSAKLRADASLLANEAIGLIWADVPGNAERYAGAACQEHAPCKAWETKVKKLMPAGAPTIEYQAATLTVQVTVGWAQPDEGEHRVVVRSAVPTP